MIEKLQSVAKKKKKKKKKELAGVAGGLTEGLTGGLAGGVGGLAPSSPSATVGKGNAFFFVFFATLCNFSII